MSFLKFAVAMILFSANVLAANSNCAALLEPKSYVLKGLGEMALQQHYDMEDYLVDLSVPMRLELLFEQESSRHLDPAAINFLLDAYIRRQMENISVTRFLSLIEAQNVAFFGVDYFDGKYSSIAKHFVELSDKLAGLLNSINPTLNDYSAQTLLALSPESIVLHNTNRFTDVNIYRLLNMHTVAGGHQFLEKPRETRPDWIQSYRVELTREGRDYSVQLKGREIKKILRYLSHPLITTDPVFADARFREANPNVQEDPFSPQNWHKTEQIVATEKQALAWMDNSPLSIRTARAWNVAQNVVVCLKLLEKYDEASGTHFAFDGLMGLISNLHWKKNNSYSMIIAETARSILASRGMRPQDVDSLISRLQTSGY